MIYLIDDKKLRQNELGWNDNKFANYSNVIKPLYTIEDIAQIEKDLYSEKNIILYHESFLDFTNDKDKAIQQREKLTKMAEKTAELSVAFFSGSQGSRTLSENIAFLPVSKLYQNLEILINHHRQGSVELKYLLFGEKPEIEQDLDKLLTDAIKNIDSKPALVSGRNLFIRPNLRNIQNAIEGAKEVSIFPDVSDEKISEKVSEWLQDLEYDNIFLPLCFGQILSDFNGLRLATHIRCTPSKNHLKRIFIYGFVGLDYLLEHEYFNILKTKNIQLVPYSKITFSTLANTSFDSFKQEELSKEIKKLKLDPPLNYADSHSIANEWAIHQWAKTIGCDETEELKKVFRNVGYNLYFKYLRTIHPVSKQDVSSATKLEINKVGDPKVLLIDDEVDKGWYEIFCNILYDVNDLTFELLDEVFISKTQDEIINASVDKVTKDDIDLVILDLRLHPNDFATKNIEEVTGFNLLKRIKKINPGIQVIMFSASNKVWNWQILNAEGADGFIIKESPEYNSESKSVEKAIITFVDSVRIALQKRFLKQVFVSCKEIKRQLNNYDYEDGSEYEAFLRDLKKQISLISDSSKRINLVQSTTLDIVFLNCFNFLEKFKHYYLKEINRQFVLGIDEVDMNRYVYERGLIENKGNFTRINQNDNPSWFNVLTGLFIDYFKISKIDDEEIIVLNEIKDKRNNYIHNQKDKFNENELLMILSVCEKLTSKMKE